MREIEFRAWDKKNKWMDDDFYLHSDGRAYDRASKTYDTPNLEIERTDDLVVMQFTGLRDKEGNKIFEGDIVHLNWIKSEYIGEVKFINGAFSVNDCVGHFGQMYASCCEVLGNIHQHPHILEQKK